MYRYSRNKPRGATESPRLRERAKTITILVLLVALIGLSVVGIPAIQFKNNAYTMFAQRIQVECANALSATTYLSRTAGASTSSYLQKIRSYIYAMETLNTMSVGSNAGWVVQESWFTTLYDLLDEYTTKASTGTTTGELVTELQTDLQTLYDQLDSLNK